MNTAIFAGRVGKDAETKSLPSGERVTNFSLAVSERTKQGETTLWVECSLWGDRWEGVTPYIVKGSSVTVRGSVSARAYVDKNNAAAASLRCVVDKLTLQSSKQSGAAPERSAAPVSNASRPSGPTAPEYEDEIPF